MHMHCLAVHVMLTSCSAHHVFKDQIPAKCPSNKLVYAQEVMLSHISL